MNDPATNGGTMQVYAYETHKAVRLYSAAKIRALIAEQRAAKVSA